MSRWISLAFAVALLAAPSVRGQIVTYGFGLENDPTLGNMIYTNDGNLSPDFVGKTGLTEGSPTPFSYGSKLTGWDGQNGSNEFHFTITPINESLVNITQVKLNFLNSFIEPTTIALRYQIGSGSFQSYGTQTIQSSQYATPFFKDLGFQSSAITFKVTANSNSELKLTNLSNSPSNPTNFAIGVYGTVQAVPEPGSMMLTGLAFAGCAGFGFYRRRKDQATATEPAQAG